MIYIGESISRMDGLKTAKGRTAMRCGPQKSIA